MNLTSAKSQKAEDKPISFVMESNGNTLKSVSLFIRPQDLSITFPSRSSVNQTLGGAWVDSFGEGLQVVNISGTTGWRTGPDGKDGIDRLIQLKNEFFSAWHTLRQKAIEAGANPDDIKLRYVDTLNRYSRVIVPQVFEVKRNKSSPLLCAYRFGFTSVANPKAATVSLAAGSFDPSGFGLSSLTSSLNKIIAYISTAKNFINTTILAPVMGFMRLSQQVLTTVKTAISAGLSLATPLINVARAIAQTGLNVFRTMAAVAGIPSQVRATLMQVAAAYSNIFCVMRNALKAPQSYENFGGLYGASNCSSTFGGAPPSRYADVNPFFAITPTSTSGVGVSSQASASIGAITRSDVVLSPMSTDAIGAHLTAINAGVVVK